MVIGALINLYSILIKLKVNGVQLLKRKKNETPRNWSARIYKKITGLDHDSSESGVGHNLLKSISQLSNPESNLYDPIHKGNK